MSFYRTASFQAGDLRSGVGILLILGVITLTLAISPVRAQTPQSQPVVRAVLFWMEGCPAGVMPAGWRTDGMKPSGCPHCHEVLENVLPPLRQKYGTQLEILLIEIAGMDDVNRLYEVAAAYGIPRQRVGVPFLVIGDQVLIGSAQIPDELPRLIESYLAQGGLDWPDIPNLEAFRLATAPAANLQPESTAAVVQGILFSTLDCHTCQLIAGQALTPLKEQYGDKLDIQVIDVVTPEDVEYLYQVAAGFGLSREQVDLPMLIIGNHALIEEQIPAELPDLVAEYIVAGGVAAPALPARLATPAAKTPATVQVETQPSSNGFTLAIGVLIGMLGALLYTIGRLIFGLLKNSPLAHPPAWQSWLIPILGVIGLGVAGYLSYIEITLSHAVCGPVGDCNAVQSSSYARLFGVLPIGVLGMAGYLAILAAWLMGLRAEGKLTFYSRLGIFGMAFFGSLFSLYLTYLEPFVIKAVCAWCIASAIIITLILLLSVSPALQMILEEDDDPTPEG